MELSTTFTKTAKKLGVSEQFVIMADLMAIGYSENDAYTIAYPENATYSIQQNNSIRANVLKTAKFKKLLADTKQRLRDKMGDPSTIEDINLIGSDEVAKEILLSAYKQPQGSKEMQTFCQGIKTSSTRGMRKPRHRSQQCSSIYLYAATSAL